LDRTPVERAVAAGTWAFLARTLVSASGFVRTLILARLLMPQDFGVIGTALVVLGAVDALTAPGFETALMQHRGDIEPFYDSAFTVQVIRGLSLAALVWIAAPAVATFVHAPVVAPVLRAVATVLILRGFANPAKVRLYRQLRYETLFWWSVPEVVVTLGSAIALGLALRNVWALVIPLIAGQAVTTVVSYVLAQRRPRVAFDRARTRELVDYSKWVLAAQIMTFLSVQGDNGFVAKFLGLGSLGFYQVAFRIAELPVTGFTQIVGQVALPSLSALQNEPGRLRSWYVNAQGVVLIVHGAFVAVVLLFAAPLTRMLLGATWTPIVPTLRILVVAMLLRSLVDLGGVLFNAVGEPRFAYRLQAVRVATMALAIYPLSQLLGVQGVAWAVLLSLLAAMALCLRTLRTTLGADLMKQFRQLVAMRF
jgi:O-antigen/teichoic acid export membrane protein